MLEGQVAQMVQGRRARTLAEAEQQEIGAQRMHVATFERVVVALLLGAVIQDPGVLETGVIAEQRLHQQLLGPAHAVAHRADDRVLPDHDPHVAGEEQVRERRKGVARLVQGTTSSARVTRNSRTSGRATSSVRSVRTSYTWAKRSSTATKRRCSRSASSRSMMSSYR